MKLIDKTPFRNEETLVIAPLDRIKATLKYGFSWYGDIQAQDTIAAVLNKNLGRGFTLLQNFTLPETEIVIPLVLVGLSGIYVIYVTTLRGLYRAKNDEWGSIDGDRFTPRENLLTRTARLTKVVQSYLDKQGFKGMIKVEPILVASDPGMHIESVRPIVRIVMSDALERFAVSMNQAQAIFSPEAVQNIINRLETPKPIAQPGSSAPEPEPQEEEIFKPVVPTGKGAEINAEAFTFEEIKPPAPASAPAAKKAPAKRSSAPPIKFNSKQWIILGVLFAAFVLILVIFILIMVFNA
jgi:hypothetical protein